MVQGMFNMRAQDSKSHLFRHLVLGADHLLDLFWLVYEIVLSCNQSHLNSETWIQKTEFPNQSKFQAAVQCTQYVVTGPRHIWARAKLVAVQAKLSCWCKLEICWPGMSETIRDLRVPRLSKQNRKWSGLLKNITVKMTLTCVHPMRKIRTSVQSDPVNQNNVT